MIRRTVAALLTLCLLVGLGLPAYAVDGVITGHGEVQMQEPTQEGQQPEDQQESQESPVTVSTLDELQAAIEAAKDGDTIAISQSIYLCDTVLSTDKHITITRTDNAKSDVLLCLGNKSGIDGFAFQETTDSYITIDVIDTEQSFLKNCEFIGSSNHNSNFVSAYTIYAETTNFVIENCSFFDNGYSAVSVKSDVEVTISNCAFVQNSSYTQGGAIYNDGGIVHLGNCIITGNRAVSGGGVFNRGNIEIINCQIYANTITNPKFGSDILSFGTLSIDDFTMEGRAVYDESTGEKLLLPLVDYADTAKLTYLTDDEAADYFKEPEQPTNPDDPAPTPDTGVDTEPTQPTTPEPTAPADGDTTPDNDNTQQPTEPDTNPQEPVQPTQPPEQEPTNPGTENTPEPPQQPTGGTESGGNDDTPTTPHRPTGGNREPIVPVPPKEPEPEPEKPVLQCGNAVIDTSRTIVLLGYGDGLLHEEDSLTRAQLATIIYRLLDEDSIAELANEKTAFADVLPNMWCYEYVQTIQNAGIVCGTGDGCYSPNGLVTWAQIVTVLSRFVEPQEYTLQHIQYQGWAKQAIQTAVALGWIEDSADFKPDTIITRGELVQLVNGVLAMYK